MWLQTTRGFVSAVEWKGGEHDGKVAVRARDRGHLESVLTLVPDGAATEINITPTGADYRYRAWLTRDGFEALMVALAREVRYGNFKDEVLRVQGRTRYEGVLHQAWSLLGRLQPRGPYGTGGAHYPPAPKGERASKQPKQKPRSSTADACFDCGATADLERVHGEWYCLDVGACVARARR